MLGGSFCFDPWHLYTHGAVTNPNVIVTGQVGRGKSSFIKTFLWRQSIFGRQGWVLDPKGEYGELAERWGVRPIRLSPGGPIRLNPLEPLVRQTCPTSLGSASELLSALLATSLQRGLLPEERAAVELAVDSVTGVGPPPTLADVVAALLNPDSSSAARIHTDIRSLATAGRQAALELRRLVEGDLSGMFDGTTSTSLDLAAPLVVVDLSALYGSPALGMLMICVIAWLQAVVARDGPAARRIVVVDEAWAVLRDLATARWLQAGFKLARAFGVAYLAVVHRLSDLRAVGAEGSAEQRLAEGLLADSETRVIFGQSRSEVDDLRKLIGLTDTEAELVPQLPRAAALWKVGEGSFIVEHHVGRHEAAIVDTDAAMRGLG
jgi:type IV secretory pathway VirB4 component